MADPSSIAGGVVGIVAFAQQLIESTIKIKRFCQDVKDAPAELDHILKQADNIEDLLKQLTQQGESAGPHVDIYRKCLDFCQSAVGNLTTLMVELKAKMKSSQIHRVKVVLKRKDIESMLLKLDRSRADLHLAYSIYQTARSQQAEQHMLYHIQRASAHMEQRMMVMQQAPDDRAQPCKLSSSQQSQISNEVMTQDHYGLRKSHRKNSERTSVRMQLPLWLCKAAWDICLERSVGRWTVSLQSVVIIPRDHEIWNMCRSGNLNGVKGLIEQRAVDINAEDEEGISLVGHTLSWVQPSLCRFLLRHGAPVPQRAMRMLGIQPDISQYELFIELAADIDELQDLQFSRHILLLWREIKAPPSTWSEEQTLLVVATLYDRKFTDGVFKLLGGNDISPKLWFTQVSVEGPYGGPVRDYSLLYLVGCWWAHVDDLSPNGILQGSIESSLCNVLEQGLRAGVNLSRQLFEGCTAFTVALRLGLQNSRLYRGVNEVVQRWVSTIRKAGVDLLDFGDVECQYFDHDIITQWSGGAVLGLACGPRPSDWFLWFRHAGDVFAGIFWDTLEHPEYSMPGAWESACLSDDGLSEYERESIEPTHRFAGMKAKTLRKIRRASRRGTENGLPVCCDEETFARLRERHLNIANMYKSGKKPHWVLLADLACAVGHAGLRSQRRIGRRRS